MVRAHVLAEFPPWFFAAHYPDWALYLLISEQGLLGYLNEIMGVYEFHARGMWSGLNNVDKTLELIQHLESLGGSLSHNYRQVISQSLAYQNYKLADCYACRGPSRREVAAALWASIRHDPAASRVGYHNLLRLAIFALWPRQLLPATRAARKLVRKLHTKQARIPQMD